MLNFQRRGDGTMNWLPETPKKFICADFLLWLAPLALQQFE
jgi:hypothetical protein